MALPTSRNTTYSPGASAVKGNDLNSIQDCIVGGKRGPMWRKLPVAAGNVIKIGATGVYTDRYANIGIINLLNVNDRFVLPIVLAEGERLLEARGWVQCGAVDVITMTAQYALIGVGSANNLAAPVASTGHVSAQETLTVPGLAEIASMANTRTYWLLFECTAFATSPVIWGGAIKTDIP